MRASPLERRLTRQLGQTAERFTLFAPDDHVMVAISGGKDSSTLLHLLERWTRSLPFSLRLTAVHLDQVQPGYDGRPLVEWLETRSVPFEILREDTYSVVTDKLQPGATYCSLCSRLRRGILYTAAERLGCNKIALGHHREDTLETLLLNLFYAGRLQALPAKYTTDDGRFEVIRPLIECAEADIAAFAAEEAFPILPCNLCGSQEGLKRERMGALLSELEQGHPNLRAVMLNALRNVSTTHLLDPELAGLRRAHARTPSVARPQHARALPVLRGGPGEI